MQEQRIPRKKTPLDQDGLWSYALRILGAKAYSVGEIREKLTSRAQSRADVDSVIRRLREYGYLDDRRFAESYASARRENQGFGQVRVLRDLSRRRVASGIAEQAVKSAFQGADEIEMIERFLERKHRKTPLATLLADPRQLAAAYRRLRTAGFSSANSIRVLKRHSRDAELLDTLETPEEGEGA